MLTLVALSILAAASSESLRVVLPESTCAITHIWRSLRSRRESSWEQRGQRCEAWAGRGLQDSLRREVAFVLLSQGRSISTFSAGFDRLSSALASLSLALHQCV